MGKSFVYNAGSSDDLIGEDELEFNFGMFFDGTLNNRRNTELRKHYRNKDQKNLTEKQGAAYLKEEEEAYARLEKRGFSKTPDEYERYLKSAHRTEADKRGTNNSYSNDYSNVARMYLCCEPDKYAIYVEGIGTEDEERDTEDGFAFGADVTGIRGKVRKGCEDLAERISKILLQRDGKTTTKITIDVFGFSRGAAAARNFVHEVNVKKAYVPDQGEFFKGYKYPTNPYSKGGPTRIYVTASCDKDGVEIDSSLLINGKMPKMGHLGYALLQKDISPKQLETLDLRIRFVGVYDTVSSYAETGNLEADDFVLKAVKEPFVSSFKNDVKELELNSLGRLAKAVHFTAKDEHRENFDLTRMPIAKEWNFPGVHCDIGGAYENEIEVIDEIEVANKQPGVGFNSLGPWDLTAYEKLEAFKQKLIDEYWYTEEQLVISDEKYRKGILQYSKLTGTRSIKKEYSYIPLHFMRELCLTYMEKHMPKNVVDEYSIKHDKILISAKKYLEEYVFGSALEWNFISDDEIDKMARQQEIIEEAKKMKSEDEQAQDLYDLPGNEGDYIRPLADYIPQNYKNNDIGFEEQELIASNIDGVTIYTGRQGVLRKLRNQYFHWSANRDWLGMDPNNNRIREEH